MYPDGDFPKFNLKAFGDAVEADTIKLRKDHGAWVPDTLADRFRLLDCKCPTRFSDEELDVVLEKVSKFGFWLGYEIE